MTLRHVFFGPVRLRAGWRLLTFSLLIVAIAVLIKTVGDAFHVRGGEGWSAGSFTIGEAMTLGIGLIATAIMARIDRLPFTRFGLSAKDAFGGRFWEGSLWGFAAVAALVGMIAMGGGYHVSGWAIHGGALVRAAAIWLVAMALVGLSEEVVFRGYALSSLADGVGFWPAALLLSLDFSLTHFFGKPMENLADALSVGLIGLFLCFSIRRTGNLWFAIGFHFGFDFAALPFFGAPNTGNGGRPIEGHLLNGVFSGPDWLTGGVRGAEASLLVFPLIAALFALIHFRYRGVRYPARIGSS